MPLEGYRKEKVIISTSAGVKWRKEGIIFLLPALIEKSKALNFGQDYHEFTMFQGILNNTAPYSIVVISLADYVFSGKNELNTS